MRIARILSAAFLLAVAASSASADSLPVLTPGKAAQEAGATTVVYEMLPESYRIDAGLFTVRVPATWTFTYSEESYYEVSDDLTVPFFSTVLMTPSTDLENDTTFFHVLARASKTVNRSVPLRDLDDLAERLRTNHPERALTFETIDGKRWLVARYLFTADHGDENGPPKPILKWAWTAWHLCEDGETEYLMLAQTPVGEEGLRHIDAIEGLLTEVGITEER